MEIPADLSSRNLFSGLMCFVIVIVMSAQFQLLCTTKDESSEVRSTRWLLRILLEEEKKRPRHLNC